MLISRETREGIKISGRFFSTISQSCIKSLCLPLHTVLSFIEMAKKLLQVPGVKFLLSERFTQDPLEEYFGRQRERGRRSDNPTADSFLHNNQTLTTIGTMTQMGSMVKGNVRGRRRQNNIDIDNLSIPLMKRKKTQ